MLRVCAALSYRAYAHLAPQNTLNQEALRTSSRTVPLQYKPPVRFQEKEAQILCLFQEVSIYTDKNIFGFGEN